MEKRFWRLYRRKRRYKRCIALLKQIREKTGRNERCGSGDEWQRGKLKIHAAMAVQAHGTSQPHGAVMH